MASPTVIADLWTHQQGGFYHDGSFATLRDVIEHYNRNFRLGLNVPEKGDLNEYLKSLPEDKETIMARLVKRFRKLPYAVTVGGETKTICGCGLSATLPFCDGTHKITESEEPDKLDWYDDAGNRHVAVDSFGRIRSDKQIQDA